MGLSTSGTARVGSFSPSLTTASTLWAVTGLGLVIGAGYYRIAVLFTVIVVITLIFFRKIEQILPRKINFQYVLAAKDRPGILADVNDAARRRGIHLDDVVLKRTGTEATVSFYFSARDAAEREFGRAVAELGEIIEVRLG